MKKPLNKKEEPVGKKQEIKESRDEKEIQQRR